MSEKKPKSKSISDFPELVKEWHPTKNGDLKPESVSFGSKEDIWWKCLEGPDHEWLTKPNYRTGGKKITGCPFCAGKKVSVTNSLAINFPEIAKEWHPTKNLGKTPDEVLMKSSKEIWWQCRVNSKHNWVAKVNDRTGVNKSGCPYCSGRLVLEEDSLAELYPEIIKEWHPTKNTNLNPNELSPGSKKKAYWICDKGPDHIWKAVIDSRIRGNRKCPYCANKKVSVTNSLATKFPEIAKEWHPTMNRDLTPNKVVPGSDKLIWWQCSQNSEHIWDTKIHERTGSKKTGCPICSHRRLSPYNSLRTLYPEIAKEWHPTKNSGLTSEMVIGGSHREVWWKCSKNSDHTWIAKINNRVHNKSGCPFCNLSGGLEIIGYLWERICHRIARYLLEGKKWKWQPKIDTPEIDERNWIFPEILIENLDGTLEIIEIKKSPSAITNKDTSIYPLYAAEVKFWCLSVEFSDNSDLAESFEFISSNELVQQLKNKINEENKKGIYRIIKDIERLKDGKFSSQQKLLTDFISIDD